MRLRRLHLLAFGPFTDRALDFGEQGLVMLYGPNEAGKSSTLRAMTDLRFGIPVQSTDNFDRPHAEMRLGGEFVDPAGRACAFVRRKGRGDTLLQAVFGPDGPSVGEPAPPGQQALLTQGLSREAYETMFAMDHARLRAGGEALLKGEGEVGAALFEASAGVRSVAGVLDALDAEARRYFMPGARGKHARINEALREHDAQQSTLREAQLRPAAWLELSRQHEAARQGVADLERQVGELNARLGLVRELRAVAPLLAALDDATVTRDALRDVPLLSPTAETERAGAESGLHAAEQAVLAAQRDAEAQQRRLEAIALDPAILSVGPAVRRLAASIDTIDRYARELAAAELDARVEAGQVLQLAARIDPQRNAAALAALAPARVPAAQIDEALQAVEFSARSLALFERPASTDPAQEPAGEPLPSEAARGALKSACAQATRLDGELRRLESLPAELGRAQRRRDAALKALDLPDEAALARCRPLLDARIDAEMAEQNAAETRRNAYVGRIADVSDALRVAGDALGRLLQAGAVATREDVDAARALRQRHWERLRDAIGWSDRPDGSPDGPGAPADRLAGGALVQAYEEAVRQADRLVDSLAGDAARASQVQARKEEIARLEHDRGLLEGRRAAVDAQEADRAARWRETLAAARLPALPAAALREWQALLGPARDAIDAHQALVDERDRLQAIEARLAAELRDAIVAAGGDPPGPATPTRSLAAAAFAREDAIGRQETAISRAAGRAAEVERSRREQLARAAELRQAADHARAALKPFLAALLLPDDASVALARARLREFADLAEARSRESAAALRAERARGALALVREAARPIWVAIGEPEPQDLRHFADLALERLQRAEDQRRQHDLARQAHESALEAARIQALAAAGHRERLAALGRAAGVASPAALPAAEDGSRRKRLAQEAIDRSGAQLAQASRRPVAELRALLAAQPPDRMDADESAWTAALGQTEDRLRAARQQEETSRRALEAIDGSDAAAAAREAMERAAAAVRTSLPIWLRTRLAHGLLTESLRRFRQRAQGPMLSGASAYFAGMTEGGFVRLLSDEDDERPVLLAQRANGANLRVQALSEGTRDQLYLALRLAALDVRRAAGVALPVVLDDILMTSDDRRTAAMIGTLASFARTNQVFVFTHHRHVVDIAVRTVGGDALTVVDL